MPPPRTLDVSSASEPYEVRSKYQQAQIEQLSRQCEDLRKQRTTDLERIRVLEAEQQAQDKRATTAMGAIQDRWKSEKTKRKQDTEIWKSMNAIAALDTRIAQYNGMMEEMRWREASRQDGIAILAREFKLAEFQSKENETYYTTRDLEASTVDIRCTISAEPSEGRSPTVDQTERQVDHSVGSLTGRS
jgi:hypothetical protein